MASTPGVYRSSPDGSGPRSQRGLAHHRRRAVWWSIIFGLCAALMALGAHIARSSWTADRIGMNPVLTCEGPGSAAGHLEAGLHHVVVSGLGVVDWDRSAIAIAPPSVILHGPGTPPEITPVTKGEVSSEDRSRRPAPEAIAHAEIATVPVEEPGEYVLVVQDEVALHHVTVSVEPARDPGLAGRGLLGALLFAAGGIATFVSGGRLLDLWVDRVFKPVPPDQYGHQV